MASTTSPAPETTDRRGVGWFALTMTLGLAALTAAHWVDSDRQLVVIAAAARWVVGLTALLTLGLALLSRQRLAIFCSAVLVAVHLGLAAPAVLPGTTSTAATNNAAPTVTVLASNLLYGRADLNQIAAAAARLQADVVVLTEVTPLGDRLEASGLARAFPHRVGREVDSAKGTLVLSRWPMTELDDGQSQYFDNPLVSVETPAGPVRVLGVHSASPGPHWRTDLHHLQSRQLQRGGPTVLAGDFNASSDHAALRKATTGFTDALPAAGRGWQPTWNVQSLPFTQIDHVFASGLQVRDAGRVLINDTDHAAVWATLERS